MEDAAVVMETVHPLIDPEYDSLAPGFAKRCYIHLLLTPPFLTSPSVVKEDEWRTLHLLTYCKYQIHLTHTVNLRFTSHILLVRVRCKNGRLQQSHLILIIVIYQVQIPYIG